MAMNVKITEDGAQDGAVSEEAEVHIEGFFGGQPGLGRRSFLVEIPAPWDDDGAAKETMMELPENTGRQWEPRADAWKVERKYLNRVIRHFTENGYNVTVDLETAKQWESETDRTFLPDERSDS